MRMDVQHGTMSTGSKAGVCTSEQFLVSVYSQKMRRKDNVHRSPW